MSDDSKDTVATTATGETAASAADSGKSYVTPDQLQDFGKNLLGDIRKTVAGMLKTQPAKTESKPKAEPSQADSGGDEIAKLRADLEASQQREKFREAAADLSLSKEQRRLLEKLASVDKPDNLPEWLVEQAKALGPAAADQSKETATMPDKRRSATDVPATAGHTPGAPGDNVLSWSKEEYDRQFALKAKVPANKYDIRNREFHREIRRRAEAEMSKTSIYVGPNKG